MSFHHDLQQWQKQSDPAHCPVCNNAPMPAGMVDVVELPHSVLCAEQSDVLKGACHLISKVHAVELFDFSDDELAAVMKEVALCARAIKQVTGAVKINYEIHGNTAPHFHVHLYPRSVDDPFPGSAIDYHQRRAWFSAEGFEAYVRAVREAILAGR